MHVLGVGKVALKYSGVKIVLFYKETKIKLHR